MKDYVERKKFLNFKNATIKIQKKFRNWYKSKGNDRLDNIEDNIEDNFEDNYEDNFEDNINKKLDK